MEKSDYYYGREFIIICEECFFKIFNDFKNYLIPFGRIVPIIHTVYATINGRNVPIYDISYPNLNEFKQLIDSSNIRLIMFPYVSITVKEHFNSYKINMIKEDILKNNLDARVCHEICNLGASETYVRFLVPFLELDKFIELLNYHGFNKYKIVTHCYSGSAKGFAYDMGDRIVIVNTSLLRLFINYVNNIKDIYRKEHL